MIMDKKKTEMDIVHEMIGGCEALVKYLSMVNLMEHYIPMVTNPGLIVSIDDLPHVPKLIQPDEFFRHKFDSCLKPDALFFVAYADIVDAFNVEIVGCDDKTCVSTHTNGHKTINEMFRSKMDTAEKNMATKVMCQLFPIHLLMTETFNLKTHSIMGVDNSQRFALFQSLGYLMGAGLVRKREIIRDEKIMNVVVTFEDDALQVMQKKYAELLGG